MVANKPTADQRKAWIVDPELQRAFVKDAVLLPVVALAATVVVVGLFCYQVQREAAVHDVELGGVVPLFVAVAAFFIAAAYAFVTQALKISNRVVGPQRSIRQAVERALSGATGVRVAVRETDYLRGVADDVNRLLEHLEEHRPSSAGAAVPMADVDAVPAPLAPREEPAELADAP
jgi:hypothetical protein